MWATIVNIKISKSSIWRLSIEASCNKPRLYSSTYPLNVTTLEANPLAKSTIAANRLADRKCALRQFAWTITMKWHETSRGDLTDKLRGMIVKRIKETRKGPTNAGIHSAGSVRPDAGRNHLFYINHTRTGRRAAGFYAIYLKASAGKERDMNGTSPYSFGFRTSPTRKESWCMSLAVMRRPDALYAIQGGSRLHGRRVCGLTDSCMPLLP